MILGQTLFGAAPLAGGEGEWVREPFGVITLTGILGQDVPDLVPPTGVVTITGSVGVPSAAAVAPDAGVISLSGFVGDPLNSKFDPPLLWPSYSSDGTNITIALADLPGLSSAEADATTGDWREVLQAIFASSWDYSQVFIDTPLRRQYDTYNVFKKDLYGSTIDSYFTFKFLTDMGEPNVAPEP